MVYGIGNLLQQYLPFTVLKLANAQYHYLPLLVATVLTVYGIETICTQNLRKESIAGCNSTYRLRY